MDITDKKGREGVRGGREQFRWDALKSQSYKDREQYLGYTTKLGVIGKFGQYQRNDWWRTSSESSNVADLRTEEKARAKKLEEELMQEALGSKPKRLLLAKSKLSSEQVSEVLKKDETSGPAGPPDAIKEDIQDSHVVSGLGFRKYLKSSDWADDEEVVELKGENVPTEHPSVKTEPQSPRRRSRSPKKYGPHRGDRYLLMNVNYSSRICATCMKL